MTQAAYYNRRYIQKYVEDYITSKKEEKLGGPLLWIILTLVLFEDASDLSDIIILGIQLIPVVGQAVGAVMLLTNTLLGFFTGGIVWMYLFFNRGNLLSKMGGKAKFWLFKTMALMLADYIPILGMLPLTTLAFLYAIKTINNGRKEHNDELPREALENIG